MQLLRSGGNDAEMEETWNKIGDYFSERHKWDEAVQYYEKARNIDQVKQGCSLMTSRNGKARNIDQVKQGCS